MITAFKPSKPQTQNTLLETGQKDEKEDSFALMMKTPKESSVLIAFQKPTAIWDTKMEDVPQLAVQLQDLKTTCSKKVEHQHSTHCNNQIRHIACHLPHEWHTSDVCHLKP